MQMEYLIRNKGAKVKAHLWNGKDTFCKMYGSGGMNTSRFSLYKSANGKDICTMCKNNYKDLICKHLHLKTNGIAALKREITKCVNVIAAAMVAATHSGLGDGACMMIGCELTVRRWVRDGPK